MTTFHLIRHGEPDWRLAAGGDLKGAAVGWAAHIVPLTGTGIRQVEIASEPLEAEDYQLVISSPMTRAHQSANVISRILHLDLHVEFDLHEWVCAWRPSLEKVNETVAEMLESEGEWPPGEMRDWEPLSSVRARVSRVLDRYENFERVIVVCHETVIFSLTGKWVGHAESVTLEM
ncbi:MAG: histidine phosphatase family protein [Candidatus Latescibacteria bacterium]|nr:histidine phosphatase family protein [Candidatus Latescibacterota bacterium]